MSVFTDYQKVSEYYDVARRPGGADVIAALVSFKLGKPLKDVHLLDMGSGTGNYSAALLEYGVGKITLADANKGMLEKAKEKLEAGSHIQNVMEIREAVLPVLPFQDQTFDAIIMNQDVHLLDIGCGTGNYSAAMLEYGVGKITLADANKGMLERAKEKLEAGSHIQNVMEIREAVLPSLPFQDQTFDAIIINQVLHHLEQNPDGEHFPVIQKTVREMNRVLRPGGIAIITSTVKPQMYGIWYYSLMPSTLDRFIMRFPSKDDIIKMLCNSDFDVETPLSYLGNDWFKYYTNIEGPLSEPWRMRDSFFSFASDEEINMGIEKVKSMKSNGTLKSFFEEHDGTSSIGTFAIFVALKKRHQE